MSRKQGGSDRKRYGKEKAQKRERKENEEKIENKERER